MKGEAERVEEVEKVEEEEGKEGEGIGESLTGRGGTVNSGLYPYRN